MRYFLLTFLMSFALYAQSFYVLSEVKEYDPLISSTPELEIYNDDILEEMREMSKELKVNIKGHPSRVLAFIVTKFSVGKTIGYKLDLELGEYMKRDSMKEGIFAISYLDTHMFEAQDDMEEVLLDNVEEMLSKFSHQYLDDNKDNSVAKVGITHENFASVMGYETDYNTALAKAKKEGKKLFIFMTTSYCPWCRKLENRMLSKVDIDKQIKAKYIPAMLNFSKKNFPKQFREIGMTPTLYVVDPKTEKIEQQFVGYVNREGFLELLKGE